MTPKVILLFDQYHFCRVFSIVVILNRCHFAVWPISIGQTANWHPYYRVMGIFCGCLIFAEFCGSIEIAEIKNRKIFQSRYNDEIVSEVILWLFFYTLWHIELKFCIWLCFSVPQIKFECHQFPSFFVGVMPLLEPGILEIHSFPHFSLTRFDILSWNLAYDFVLLYLGQVRVSSISVHFVGVMPLLECRILKIHSFPHFSLTRFDILSWILHMTLFYCTTDQVRVLSISVNFCRSYAPFGT